MEAVLERMRRTQSAALVRVGSQWWATEADAGCCADWAEVSGKFRPLFPAFQTSTVNALVARGELRLTGGRRKTPWPPHTSVPFRAEFKYA